MAEIFTEITDRLAEFIAAQHVFFVASAPTSADGLVNVSPKGLDTFRVLDGTTVASLDGLPGLIDEPVRPSTKAAPSRAFGRSMLRPYIR